MTYTVKPQILLSTMFLKPFRVKSQTAIKGSVRKTLRAELGKSFPALTQDQLIVLVPPKEEITVMKILTRKQHKVTVYCVQKNPMFFEIENTVFPTVYMLWKYPDALPAITMWDEVFNYISNGADLMLPGVIAKGDVTPQNLGNLEKGQMCSVKLLGNKAPVAVGRATMSSIDMCASSMRGKGVVILHSFKDTLWKSGDMSHPPLIEDAEMLQAVRQREAENNEQTGDDSRDVATQQRAMPQNADEALTTLCGPIDAVNLSQAEEAQANLHEGAESEGEGSQSDGATEGAEGGTEYGAEKPYRSPQDEALTTLCGPIDAVNLSQAEEAQANLHEGAESEGEGSQNDGATEGAEGGTEYGAEKPYRSPQERMDGLMEFCFKCAVKFRLKRRDLPLLTSTFFKLHMQPFCPVDEVLNLRQSSDKKVGRFLKRMESEEYIKLEELSPGVYSIIEYDRTHLGLRGLQVPEISNTDTGSNDDCGSSVFVMPEIIELYTLTPVVVPLFRELGEDKRNGDPVTAKEMRDYITRYVTAKQLQNRSQVTLDAILGGIVQTGDKTLRWDELFTSVIDKLSPAYQLIVPGKEPVLKKGKIKPVTLKIRRQGGKKKVTSVTNLELFDINAQQFAQTVQKKAGCSASLKGKPGSRVVFVQGNQVRFIGTLLNEEYQFPKRYLHGLESAPQSGSSRR